MTSLLKFLAVHVILISMHLLSETGSAQLVEKKDDPKGGLKNVAVYSSKLDVIKFSALQEIAKAESAKLELVEGTEADWKSVKVSWSDKSLTISRDSGKDLAGHLNGFQGFVFSQLAGGKMDAHVFQIIKRIGRTKQLFGCVGEPSLHDDSMKFVSQLATQEKAICFLDNAVWDSQLKVLIGPENHRDKDASFPAFDSAVERKAATIKSLKAKDIPTLETLPVIVADEEVRLRTARQVARRAVCLMAVACEAEGRPNFSALKFLEENGLVDELTPNEKELLQDRDIFDQSRSKFTWRYESLAALMWCLKHREDLPFPDEQQAPAVDIKLIEKDVAGFVKNAKLRSASEILNQNDLSYRCMWAGVNARQKGAEQKGMILSVVYERLYAFNWITDLNNKDWDEVDTDT